MKDFWHSLWLFFFCVWTFRLIMRFNKSNFAWPVLLSTTIRDIIVVKMLWNHEAQPSESSTDHRPQIQTTLNHIRFVFLPQYCIFAPLNFNTEFFLSLDNEDKLSSKRCAINLVSLLFLLSPISKSLLINIKDIKRTLWQNLLTTQTWA